jgi:hypothetical protein
MKLAVRLVVGSLLVASLGLPATAGVTVESVKSTRKFEGYPTATNDGVHELFAWTQSVGGRYPLAAFTQTDGAQRQRVNRENTYGFMGTFDAGTDTLIYQQTNGRQSDLFLFDVGEGTRSALGDINDAAWQWGGAIDSGGGGEWVLYGVNKFSSPSAKWRVYVVNRTTDERILLDQSTNRCQCLFPGNVAWPYVTWTKGVMGNAFRYNLDTDEQERIELPTDRDEYASAVTTDGTMYVAQAGDRCGTNAMVFRVDPGGDTLELVDFANGREPLSLAVDERVGTDLYFDRAVCRSGTSDILRITGADTASATMRSGVPRVVASGLAAEPRLAAAVPQR